MVSMLEQDPMFRRFYCFQLEEENARGESAELSTLPDSGLDTTQECLSTY